MSEMKETLTSKSEVLNSISFHYSYILNIVLHKFHLSHMVYLWKPFVTISLALQGYLAMVFGLVEFYTPENPAKYYATFKDHLDNCWRIEWITINILLWAFIIWSGLSRNIFLPYLILWYKVLHPIIQISRKVWEEHPSLDLYCLLQMDVKTKNS